MAVADFNRYVPSGLAQPGKGDGGVARFDQYLTGQNRQGTANGWDTPFYQKFVRDYQTAMDNRTADTYFLNRNSGIAWTDQEGVDDQGNRQRVQAGDVFDGGRKVGNLYEQYGEDHGNQVLARFWMDPQQLARIQDPAELNRVVREKQVEDSGRWKAAQTRAETDRQVAAQKEEWGDAMDVAGPAASAAGGAVVGAGIGSFVPGLGTGLGAAVGGAIGAVGGWLNRDELEEQAARGEVQARLAEQEAPGAGAASRLQAWSGFAGQALNPLGNVVHGLADTEGVGWGRQGDNRVAYYDTDPTGRPVRNPLWSAADLGAAFVGAAGQFATGVGAATFTAQMAGQIGGKVGTMAMTGGQTFDERSGTFDNVFFGEDGEFDLLSSAAGIGEVGIDVLQLGMGRGLMKQAAAAGRTSAPGVARASGLKQLFGGADDRVVEAAGAKFFKDASGNVVSHRLALSALAPSEMVAYLGARTSALVSRGSMTGGKLGADEIYQAATRMATKSRVVPNALITGFGEGLEEAVQTVLEPISHNREVDPQEVLRSAWQGFAAGAGMSVGSNVGAISAADRAWGQAETLSQLGTPITREEWDAKTDQEKRSFLAQPKVALMAARSAAESLVAESKAKAVRSVPALAVLTDTQRNQRARAMASAQDALDKSMVITKAEATIPDHAMVTSLNTLVTLFDMKVDRAKAMSELPAVQADPAQLDAVVRLGSQTERILHALQSAQSRFYATGTGEAEQATIVEELNELLADSWKVPASGDLGMAKAVSMLDLRNPADNKGSFQLLMPQVSIENSRRRAPNSARGQGDNVIQMTLGPTEMQGADFDGDKATALTSVLLDDDQFRSLRIGSNLLGTLETRKQGVLEKHNVGIMKRAWEEAIIVELGATLQDTTNQAAATNLGALVDNFMKPLRARYGSFAGVALDKFEARLRAGKANAKDRLLQDLYENHLSDIQELSLKELTNEWFLVNTAVHRMLNEAQMRMAAAYSPKADPNEAPRKFQVIPGESKLSQVRTTFAATQTQTVWQTFKGAKIFRKLQVLNYTPYRSPQVERPQAVQDVADWLTKQYLRLSSGMVESKLASLRGKGDVTDRVAAALLEMAEGQEGELPNGRAAVLQLGLLQVPDYRPDGSFGNGNLALVQALLRQSVADERRKFAGIATEEQLAKWSVLENAKPHEAMVHVFESWQVQELLGLDGDVFGSTLTVGQVLYSYVNQSKANQQLDIELLRSHPSYLARGKKDGKHNAPYLVDDFSRDDSPLTPYQVFVDLIEEAGNKTISWNAEERRAGGRIGKASAKVSKDFRRGFTAMQQALASKVAFDTSDPVQWRLQLERSPKMAAAFLRTIAEDARFAVLRPTADGETIMLPDWVFGMLTGSATDAELVLFRQTLLASWAVMGPSKRDADGRITEGRSPDRMTDRLHILMHRLASDPNQVNYLRFIQQLKESQSVDDFIAFVNTELRGNEAPYTAWNRDVAEIDPGASDGAMSPRLPGSEQRKAMREFRKMAEERFSKNLTRRIERDRMDEQALLELDDLLADRGNPDNARRLRALSRRIEFARKFRPPLGPSGIVTSVSGIVTGEMEKLSDKGKSATKVAVNGPVNMMNSGQTFATSEELNVDMLTAVDASDVAMNAPWLNGSMMLMDSSGTPISWDGLDLDTLADAYRVPANRAFLSSILFPSVYEHVGNDRIAQRFVGDPSLANLMSDDDLMLTLTGESTHRKHLHAAYLEGVAGNQDVQRFLAAALIFNTTSRTTTLRFDEAGFEAAQALGDLVDIVRLAATLATVPAGREVLDGYGDPIDNPTELDAVREELKKARGRRFIGRRNSKEWATWGPEMIQLAYVEMREAANADGVFDSLTAEAAIQLLEDARATLDPMLMNTIAAAFRLEPAPKAAELDAWMGRTEEKRRSVHSYVTTHGSILSSAHWSLAVRKVWDPATEKDVDGLPVLSPKEWHELSRVAFVHMLQEKTTTTTVSADVSDAPDLYSPDLRYYDPTGNALLDDVLSVDSPLIKAELELRKQVPTIYEASPENLVTRVQQSFLRDEKLGVWTDAIPVAIQEANNRIDSSGAPEMIAAGGSLPKNGIAVVAATTRNFTTLPLDTHFSKVSLDLDELTAPDDAPLLVQRPKGAVDSPQLLLDGRFARSVTVNGVDLLHRQGAAAGYLFTGSQEAIDSGLRVVTRKRIELALRAYARDNNLPIETLVVDIEFLHPDDQPAGPEYANSGYFEGVVSDGDVDLPSLLSGWWFQAGGVDPDTSAHALQANKKGTRAQRKPRLITREEASAAEARWDLDYAGMLRRKADLLLERDRLGEGENIRPVFYNAMVKLLKVRHLVRGINGAGEPVLLSSEEMIAAQAAGRDLYTELGLTSWELVRLSPRVMRTLHGEQGDRGVLRASAEPAGVTPDQIPKWSGSYSPEQASRLSGLLAAEGDSFRTMTLFDTDAVNRDDLVPVSKLTGLDQAQIDKVRMGMTYLSATQSDIHGARAQARNSSEFPQALQTAVTAITPPQGASVNLGLIDSRIPVRGRSEQLDKFATNEVQRRLREFSEAGGLETGFIYQHLAPAQGAKEHGFSRLYGLSSLRNEGKAKPYRIAPGDLVAIDLDSFGDLESDITTVLQTLMNAGARIGLTSETNNRRLMTLASHYLNDGGYSSANLSRVVFEMDNPMNSPATVRALYSQLAATRTLDVDSLSLVLHSNLGGNEENSAWRLDSTFGQAKMLGVNLLPTSLHSFERGRFALPTPAQMKKLRPRIQAGLDEYTAMTVKMLKGTKPEVATRRLQEALDKAELLLDDGTYSIGTELLRGDIIPLYDASTDRLLLYRHGHQAPTRAQLREMFHEYNGNAIYTPELDPAKTAYEGQIMAFDSTPKYGMKVELRVPMQAIADKIVFDKSGFKIIPTAVPEHLRLSLPEGVPGVPVEFVIGTSDADSKSNYLNMLRDFNSGITFLGADFRAEIAEGLLGSTSAEALARVDTLLSQLHRFLPKFRIEVVDELMKQDSLDPALLEVLRGITLPQDVILADDLDALMGQAATSNAARIARAAVLYLMYEKSNPRHILSSAGVASARAASTKVFTRQMPELFTQVFDNTAKNDPLRAYMLDKLNQRFGPKQTTPDGRSIGYELQPDFQVKIGNVDPRMSTTGYLQFIDVASAGANPVLDLLASERTAAQKVSESQSSMALAALGASTPTKDLTRTNELFSGAGVSRMETVDELLHTLRDVQRDPQGGSGYTYTRGELEYLASARAAMLGFRQPLDLSKWSKEEREEYIAARGRLAARFGLKGRQVEMIDYWVRQHHGRPTDKKSDVGWISKAHALEYLERIEINRRDGMLPTLNAAVPLLHVVDLKQLYQASQKGSGFTLRTGLGPKATEVTGWLEWAHVALGIGSTKNEFFDPMFLTPTDGMLHTYLDSGVRFTGLPISSNTLRASRLVDPDVSMMLLSVSQQRRNKLRQPELLAIQGSLEEINGGTRTGLTWEGRYPPATAVAERSSRIWAWRKEGKIPRNLEATYANFLKHGISYVEEGNRQSAPLRIATNLRAGLALLNPMLYFGAPAEALVQNTLEAAANALTGDSTRGPAARLYTSEQRAHFRRVDDALGQNPLLKGMIYSEIALDSHLYNAGRIEMATAWWARFAGRWQDPYYGMKASSVARRYRESVTRSFNADPALSNIDADMVADRLIDNPHWVRDNHPAVHQMAMNTIREVRNVKATTMSLAWRSVVEPLSTSPRMSVAWPSTLFLKIPFMFSGYFFNKMTQVLGLQGLDAAAAAFLHGREKGAAGMGISRLVNAVAGHDPSQLSDTYDFSEAIEYVDLTTAFVKSGLTHFGLLTLGSAMGGFGLSGEDDEDRRRRLAAREKGFAYLYDPRDIVNDFRNADAVYLDNFYFLDSLFRVVPADGEGGEGRSMAHMHWIVKQVLSPLIGMERFFNTGNHMEILWGFEAAVGSLPLVNTMRWDDAAKAYAELVAAAETESERGNPQTLPYATSLLMSAFINLERMLLESSFANSIYVGWDKFDRDPWALPEQQDGEIVRDRLGLPQRTDAMKEFQDPETGETRMGYVGRDWWSAQIHALTENRGTMALLGELFTWFGGDFFRSDQVAKVRTFDKQELGVEEAEALFRAAWKGGAKPGMIPGLEGRYVTAEVRAEVEAIFRKEVAEESKAMKLNEYATTRRMNEIWYGPRENPEVPGLEDILYGKNSYKDWIGYKQSTKYYQLNTTYIIGPDGKPWATGISRNLLQTALGFAPLQGYQEGSVGGMNVDGLLNSVDEGRGMNTGFRALMKIDESFDPRNDEQPKAAAPATTTASSGNGWKDFGSGWRNFGRSGWRNFGGGGWGGGGGGGGGFSARLNAPERQQAPYANDVQSINGTNPIIRRSSIRRERIESQKGRLKSWQ